MARRKLIFFEIDLFSNNQLFLFQLDNFFVAKISVLVKDSYELSHPISVEVINPNDIPSIFDSISYDKVIEQ